MTERELAHGMMRSGKNTDESPENGADFKYRGASVPLSEVMRDFGADDIGAAHYLVELTYRMIAKDLGVIKQLGDKDFQYLSFQIEKVDGDYPRVLTQHAAENALGYLTMVLEKYPNYIEESEKDSENSERNGIDPGKSLSDIVKALTPVSSTVTVVNESGELEIKDKVLIAPLVDPNRSLMDPPKHMGVVNSSETHLSTDEFEVAFDKVEPASPEPNSVSTEIYAGRIRELFEEIDIADHEGASEATIELLESYRLKRAADKAKRLANVVMEVLTTPVGVEHLVAGINEHLGEMGSEERVEVHKNSNNPIRVNEAAKKHLIEEAKAESED